MHWFEQARAAEETADWDTAIALVSARAECYSADPALHNNHLWHLDLLARAGRVPDLEHLALTDRHALRRLTRLLRDRAADNQRPPLNRPAAQGPSATTEPGRSG